MQRGNLHPILPPAAYPIPLAQHLLYYSIQKYFG